MTGRRGFVPIMLEKTLLRSDPLLMQRALETLNTFRVPLEHMPSGVDTLCLLVPECALAPCREALQRALFTALKPDSIELGKPLALLAIVGNGMRGRRGVAAQVLDALADDGIGYACSTTAPAALRCLSAWMKMILRTASAPPTAVPSPKKHSHPI